MNPVYKICDHEVWNSAVWRGVFTGAGIDIQDGYIHFSTAAQVRETAARHFHGRTGLVMVEVDITALEIRWEPSRGGDLFPHLYDDLPVSHAISVTPMRPDENGIPVPEGGFPPI